MDRKEMLIALSVSVAISYGIAILAKAWASFVCGVANPGWWYPIIF